MQYEDEDSEKRVDEVLKAAKLDRHERQPMSKDMLAMILNYIVGTLAMIMGFAALYINPSNASFFGYDTGARSYITDAPIRTSAIKPEKRKKKAKKKVDTYKITAYCPCEKCSEGYGDNTSIGVIAKEGRTIAVDPDVIPYGTIVHINGIGDFIAEDCGGNVKGKHIDIYFESHQDTVRFGVKYKKIERR